MACTLISLGVIYHYERRIALMPLMSGVAVTIFGLLTLYLHNDLFIKIKPTLINLLFAGVLLFGYVSKKPLLKYVLSDALQMSDEGWMKLSLRWGCFFIFLAILNELVWRNFSTDFWVSFKVFGMFTLTLLFTATQLPMIERYALKEKID